MLSNPGAVYRAKVVAAAEGEEKTGREENAEWKGALHSGGYNMLSFIVQNGQIIQLCCELQTPPLQHLI